MADGFPHSVAASQRHLSPLRRERKGAKAGKFAPFLDPVDRGRGGERSSTEWRSIFHRSDASAWHSGERQRQVFLALV